VNASRSLTLPVAAIAAISASVVWTADATAASLPERVTFASADGRTTLVGYVFLPEGPHSSRTPAVVMMYCRAGAYSSAANGKYDASTLSKRHQQWGHIWAQQGYLAIMVDGFGPRGYPHGFPRFSYDSRPDELNEVTVRPLDAYGWLTCEPAATSSPIGSRCRAGPTAAAPRSPRCQRPRPVSPRRRLPPVFAPDWRFILPAV
jgi:hypothetical protein